MVIQLKIPGKDLQRTIHEFVLKIFEKTYHAGAKKNLKRDQQSWLVYTTLEIISIFLCFNVLEIYSDELIQMGNHAGYWLVDGFRRRRN